MACTFVVDDAPHARPTIWSFKNLAPDRGVCSPGCIFRRNPRKEHRRGRSGRFVGHQGLKVPTSPVALSALCVPHRTNAPSLWMRRGCLYFFNQRHTVFVSTVPPLERLRTRGDATHCAFEARKAITRTCVHREATNSVYVAENLPPCASTTWATNEAVRRARSGANVLRTTLNMPFGRADQRPRPRTVQQSSEMSAQPLSSEHPFVGEGGFCQPI
jgi:hypothetical protein